MPLHFGVTVREGKKGLRLTRDKYAIINDKNTFYTKFRGVEYSDDTCERYSENWCLGHQQDCLENFDLSMEYYALLDKKEFDENISGFMKQYNEFSFVEDLNEYSGVDGYYVMILDDYCQVYVGTAKDIMKRIRQHWSTSKSFDRLLFPIGAVNTSVMSIDSFRALDTTRILVCRTEKLYDYEDDYINGFSSKFVINRLGGGRIEGGYMEAISKMKSRQLGSN